MLWNFWRTCFFFSFLFHFYLDFLVFLAWVWSLSSSLVCSRSSSSLRRLFRCAARRLPEGFETMGFVTEDDPPPLAYMRGRPRWVCCMPAGSSLAVKVTALSSSWLCLISFFSLWPKHFFTFPGIVPWYLFSRKFMRSWWVEPGRLLRAAVASSTSVWNGRSTTFLLEGVFPMKPDTTSADHKCVQLASHHEWWL